MMEGSESVPLTTDPDPGGPKTYISYGSRSGTLKGTQAIARRLEQRASNKQQKPSNGNDASKTVTTTAAEMPEIILKSTP